MSRRWRFRTLVALLGALLAAPAGAGSAAYLLVVNGIGGEPEYADRFHRWAAELVDVATVRLGIPPARVTWLAESPERAPGLATGPVRREAVLQALAALAEHTRAGDAVLIVLLGHGTAQGGRALFNLPGPDLSAGDLSAALDALPGRALAIVNTAPASAPYIAALSAPGRIVMTATASAAENLHTRFGGHFVAALAGQGADLDKDGRLSLLEAFEHARSAVRADYERDGRLLSEHALLDDDGDGSGSRAPVPGGDGTLAAAFFLGGGGAGDAADPRREALESGARVLLASVEALRRDRDGLEARDYEARLESVLVELALNRRALRLLDAQ